MMNKNLPVNQAAAGGRPITTSAPSSSKYGR